MCVSVCVWGCGCGWEVLILYDVFHSCRDSPELCSVAGTGVLQSDSARLGQLRCHTARDGHLYRKFTWGNRKSLFDEPQAKGVDIRSEIVSYYR
jgi:hypothetical protein